MPRRDVRASRRGMGCITALIVLLALTAAGLVCAIVWNEQRPPADIIENPAEGGGYVRADDLPETELVLKADTYNDALLPTEAVVTPTPAPTATPSPTPDNSDPNAAVRPAAMGDNLLPIFKKAFTKRKVIAVTLDECSGATIMEQFIELAEKYNAKLTLFPTGENILKNGMRQVLQKCLFQLDYEIENRCFSPMAKLFQGPSSVMVQEIWKQSAALNYVLNVKYEPHFLRLYGGLGENDPRTHAYLKQQGYYGIAHWTVSGSDTPAEKFESLLTPGGIYLFKTTKKDLELMKALLDTANQHDYHMVTLNDLFGYEPNNYYRVEGSLLSETMPEFDWDDNAIYEIIPGETSYGVARMQQRLGILGYLVGSRADGAFGEATSNALRLFQVTVGLPATGAGDIPTLERLFAADAPVNPKPIATPTPTPDPDIPLLPEEGPLKPSEDFEAR